RQNRPGGGLRRRPGERHPRPGSPHPGRPARPAPADPGDGGGRIVADRPGSGGPLFFLAPPPLLIWRPAGQVAAVSLVAALLILIGVMTAEEVPAGGRAWSIGVLGMA